jgi:hypothetical protein
MLTYLVLLVLRKLKWLLLLVWVVLEELITSLVSEEVLKSLLGRRFAVTHEIKICLNY